MGHHYKVFNKSKDDAEEKKKKKWKILLRWDLHLEIKIFLFFSLYFDIFWNKESAIHSKTSKIEEKKKKKRKGRF